MNMKCIKEIALLFIVIIFLIKTNNARARPTKDKHPVACQKIILSQQPGEHVSLWMLNLMTLLTTLLFLSFLGVIKGIMGLCCCMPVGMWGLGTLIDLPQPLEHYQESDLRDTPVVYDHIGWPIHPETGKRSVRALTKKTEFCLNAIFFLTYPLAILITVCGSCCFHESSNPDECQCVNTVTFDYSHPKKKTAIKMKRARTIITGQQYDRSTRASIYGNDDSDEENDARYVQQQQNSRESLKRESRRSEGSVKSGASAKSGVSGKS